MPGWRKRSCPECGHVGNAGAFRHVVGGSWGSDALRACPACGHRAPTSTFRVVDERRMIPIGVQPNADRCIVCGTTRDLTLEEAATRYMDGGSALVAVCPAHRDTHTVSVWLDEWASHMRWSNSR